MKSIGLGVLGIIAGLSMACGGGSSGLATQVDANSAKGTTTGAVGVRTSMMGSNGGGAGGAVASMAAAAQATIQPKSTGVGLTIDPENFRRPQTGTCTCTATSCTFDNCGSSGNAISGTITVAGDAYTFDLTITANNSGVTGNYKYKGTLTITASKISGSFSFDGTGSVSGLNYESETDATFNDVVLDASGCATGGNVDVSVDYSVTGANIPGGAGSYSGSGTVTFGPACGAATAS